MRHRVSRKTGGGYQPSAISIARMPMPKSAVRGVHPCSRGSHQKRRTPSRAVPAVIGVTDPMSLLVVTSEWDVLACAKYGHLTYIDRREELAMGIAARMDSTLERC